MRLSISEILQKIHEIHIKNTSDRTSLMKQKVKVLRENDSPILRVILFCGLDINKPEWILPKGIPEYKENDSFESQGLLYNHLRTLRIFWKENNPYPQMSNLQRETKFIQFIETIDKEDAKLILALKDGEWPYKRSVNRTTVNNAFPGLLTELDESATEEGENGENT